MSGDGPSAKARAAAATTALLYAMTVAVLLGSVWLFASNLPQLVPRGGDGGEAMQDWRKDDGAVRSFAGGFWRLDAFWRSLRLTVVTATVTMVLAALVGLPAAWALSRNRLPGRGVIEVLFASIIVLPSSSVGLCLVVLFQHTPLYDLQHATGWHVVYALPGIVAAQLVLALAMGVSAWKAAFDGVNPRLEHVARSLGSRPFRVFRTVTLPCAKGGVVAGLILAWTRAAAEFGGILIFCSTFAERAPETFSPLARAMGLHQADPLAVAMWAHIEYGNVELGYAVGFVLVFIGALSVYTIHRLGGTTYVR